VVSDAVYPWHKGGKEVRYRELLPRLASRGVSIEVCTMQWWPKSTIPNISEDSTLSYRAICRQHPMYVGERRSIKQAVFFAFATTKILFRPCDLIEADSMPYVQLLPLRAVAFLKRVPLLVTWHEVWGKEYWKKYLGTLGAIGALIERIGAHLGTVCFAVTSDIAIRLHDLGVDSAKVTVIPNAVDVQALQRVEAIAKGPEIVFAGRLIQHKRVDVALRAFALIHSQRPEIRFGIIGTGPEERALKNLSVELGIDSNVTFFGEVDSHEKVWSLIKGARVFLSPSEREGFGLSVAEALVAGVPVVVSDAADNASAELVIHGLDGSIAKAGNSESFARETLNWLSAPLDREKQSRQFLARNPHLNWDSVADRYVEKVKEMVGR